MDEICKLAKIYNAILVVDEAHSFGVVGPKGLGVAEHFNLIDQVDVIVGTMSKAVGSVGGFVVTNSEIVQKFDITHLLILVLGVLFLL
ncbi:aminotransferase class I/II-fold pyridoxal phosphate-dependent enzyme [Priestia megaterium]